MHLLGNVRAVAILVLITGTGRSGTSTMSGTLHRLGLLVPGPYLKSNDSNPRGFYENAWSVRFHNSLNERAGVNMFDSRPSAVDQVQAAVTPRDRQRLRRFLARNAAPQVVVKDPRTVFTQRLWREEAAGVGLDIRYVCLLRHPAEVVGSRTTYYASKDPHQVRGYQISNIARWVNATLISERETRGWPRAFVPYVDLLADWRGVMRRVGDNLGLAYNADLASGEVHDVDDFIEPSLRRHSATWADMSVPGDLSALAEEIWRCMSQLAEADGLDPAASRRLDELSDDYNQLLADNSAVCIDVIAGARAAAALQARRAVSAEEAADTGDRRRVGEVGGRDLVLATLGRIRGRVGRRTPG